MIEKIEPAAAIRLLDAGKATAVDVREPDEFAVGHIPGAKLLPLGEVLSRAAEVLHITQPTLSRQLSQMEEELEALAQKGEETL